jgi:hypothetical protein
LALHNNYGLTFESEGIAGPKAHGKEDVMRFATALLIGGAILSSIAAASAQELDWQKVDDALGRKAAVVAGDVHRYGFPRTDLTVTLDGVTIKPALALGGWVAFKAMHGEAMAMGDLVHWRPRSIRS